MKTGGADEGGVTRLAPETSKAKKTFSFGANPKSGESGKAPSLALKNNFFPPISGGGGGGVLEAEFAIEESHLERSPMMVEIPFVNHKKREEKIEDISYEYLPEIADQVLETMDETTTQPGGRFDFIKQTPPPKPKKSQTQKSRIKLPPPIDTDAINDLYGYGGENGKKIVM